MGSFLTGIISITVSAVILANVFITSTKDIVKTCVPGALGALCNGTADWGTNATGVGGNAFTGGESAMWGLITLIAIVGMVYGVINVFGLA